MISFLLTMSKITLLAFYAVAGLAYFVPGLTPYSLTLVYVALFLVVAHLGEYLWIRNRLTQSAPNNRNHFIATLLFGFLYWLPLLKSNNR